MQITYNQLKTSLDKSKSLKELTIDVLPLVPENEYIINLLFKLCQHFNDDPEINLNFTVEEHQTQSGYSIMIISYQEIRPTIFKPIIIEWESTIDTQEDVETLLSSIAETHNNIDNIFSATN